MERKEISLENMVSKSFTDIYKGKKVLVTGHTGFKGSWLALWLSELGANVIGYSLYLPSNPCNFSVLGLKDLMTHIEGDIRDETKLKGIFTEYKPDIVFHLAAQPIVRRSYEEPRSTFEANLMGTVNVLECIRNMPSVQAAVLITSDKCYENVEQQLGYKETDRLGGKDPYSASKACAEIAASAYLRSYFSEEGSPAIVTARAGNVIGGGDWAQDRIIPDCVRALSSGSVLEVRNPTSIRPWQHVLESLSGYLWLCVCLLEGREGVRDESFNFGPDQSVDKTVGELIDAITKGWGIRDWNTLKKEPSDEKECTFLKLNCDKARNILGWTAALSYDETVSMTVDWYKKFYSDGHDMRKFTVSQIAEYAAIAAEREVAWTQK